MKKPLYPSKYLSIPQTAVYLGCSVRTVQRMLKRKTFPYRKIGKRIFIDPAEVEQALNKHKILA